MPGLRLKTGSRYCPEFPNELCFFPSNPISHSPRTRWPGLNSTRGTSPSIPFRVRPSSISGHWVNSSASPYWCGRGISIRINGGAKVPCCTPRDTGQKTVESCARMRGPWVNRDSLNSCGSGICSDSGRQSVQRASPDAENRTFDQKLRLELLQPVFRPPSSRIGSAPRSSQTRWPNIGGKSILENASRCGRRRVRHITCCRPNTNLEWHFAAKFELWYPGLKAGAEAPEAEQLTA